MSFYRQLVAATEQPRQQLLAAPIIRRALAGEIGRDDYLAFLEQAFHHVKQTVPLLMMVGARLPDDKEWLRAACAEYIEEEIGHHEWILNDIAALGGDKEAVRHGVPLPATELMVAYAWDMVSRVNPLGFFGMVLVLEGTSIAIADRAAVSIQQTLGLPDEAFSYLRSHGALDQEHVRFYEGLMDRITDPQEQRLLIHAATMFYRLYGDIFRALG
jgi:pyrroloquinoline quinone (PQQ) biosynthesis protein C